MDMSGEQEIAAPRETVWAALNDPETLKASIPGCQSIEKTSDTTFSAKVKAKVGPVNATFNGDVSLTNLNPPESYTISGEGSGGAAGFAKGGADVVLEDHGDSTLLKYDVHAQVGGKLAQLGQRLIKSTANKYAKQFFESFTHQVAPSTSGSTSESVEAEQPTTEASSGQTASKAQAESVPTAAPASSGEPQPAPAPEAGEEVAEPDAAAQPVADIGETSPGAAPQSANTAPPTADREAAAPESGRRRINPIAWIVLVITAAIVLVSIFAN